MSILHVPYYMYHTTCTILHVPYCVMNTSWFIVLTFRSPSGAHDSTSRFVSSVDEVTKIKLSRFRLEK